MHIDKSTLTKKSKLIAPPHEYSVLKKNYLNIISRNCKNRTYVIITSLPVVPINNRSRQTEYYIYNVYKMEIHT